MRTPQLKARPYHRRAPAHALSPVQVLEKFQFSLTDDDFDKKWKCVGWPRKLEETIDHEEELLEKDRERFHENMVADQENFSKEVGWRACVAASRCPVGVRPVEALSVANGSVDGLHSTSAVLKQ